MLAALPVTRLSIAITRWPSAIKRSVKCEPKKPAPPVTTETTCDLGAIARSIYRLCLILASTKRMKLQISRSEEHTSELQSRRDLVCRLLLETDPAPTQIYTLSLHDALPISGCRLR